MKNFKFCLLVLLCLYSFSFTSCSDDELVLTIEASGNDVVKALKDTNADLYYTGKLPDDVRLRMNFYVYKSTTSLSGSEDMVSQGTVLLDDITKTVTFNTTLAEAGYYQAITVCDIVSVNSSGGIKQEYNTVSAETNRPWVLVSMQNKGGHFNAFGTAYKDFDIESSQTMPLSPKPAGGLITIRMMNIDVTEFPSFRYSMDGEKYAYYNAKYTSASSVDRTLFYITPQDGYEYWDQLYCVPSVDSYLRWGTTGLGLGKALPITPGVNNYVEIDFTSAVATIYNEVIKN